jgi:DMSO reductase family type II enzyme chaperone
MQTQSDLRPVREWTACSDGSKRSVFGNYRDQGKLTPLPADVNYPAPANQPEAETLQTAVDIAVARAFIYRFLAQAFRDPTPEVWRSVNDSQTHDSLRAGAAVLGDSTLPGMESFISSLAPDVFESFLAAYLVAFGHAARGSCPLNEIEYGEIKADPLYQPHRLADLAAFYRAFGLEIADDAGERHDHICLELEFMCVLAAKQAYALEHQLDEHELALCRDAQGKFLREHLGRWTPAFARRLAAGTNHPTLQALAGLTRSFVESECARFGVQPGSEDLILRPVNEMAERMCDSCGIPNLPPGAVVAT